MLTGRRDETATRSWDRVKKKKRQAEALAQKEEEILWEKGLLGDKTPQSLLDTMVFCNGLYFTLWSGDEHRWLRLHQAKSKLLSTKQQ